MQPSGPKMNPVEAALQQQAMGLQLKQIEAQNKLANAETAKTLAEANKIAGVDTKGQELSNKWQEIENRIQLSKENIAESNITEAAANAKEAVELWKQEALNTKYLDETQEERVAKLISEIALLQKEGAVQELKELEHRGINSVSEVVNIKEGNNLELRDVETKDLFAELERRAKLPANEVIVKPKKRGKLPANEVIVKPKKRDDKPSDDDLTDTWAMIS